MIRHLVHVGFPKAGSTFLQRWFDAHPQILHADGGLAGFRDVYALVRQAADPGAVPPLWAVTSAEDLTAPRPSAGRMAGDYGAMGDMAALQEAACATVADLFPNAHILIVTRGFRAMTLSSYSQYVRQGGSADLADLGRGGGAHPWAYDRVIGLYAGRFGRERLVLLPYELLRDDPARFVDALAERLGTDPHPPPAERVNPSLSGAEMRWYPRIARKAAALPLPGGLRRYLVRSAFENRLRRPIALLQRLRPLDPIGAASIPDEALERFRGNATLLAGEPLFAPYARDYLF